MRSPSGEAGLVGRLVAVGLVMAGLAAGMAGAGGAADGLGVAALAGSGDVGCANRSGCLDDGLERWVMAVWFGRVVGLDTDAVVPKDRFADVSADVWWAPYVEGLADLGLVDGCSESPARFCPDDPVSRGQMATLLVRAFGLGRAPSTGFADLEGNVHAASIDALAAAGVTTGCGEGWFCPDELVTRGQMATFLNRLLSRHPHVPPPAGWGRVSIDVPDVELVRARSGQPVSLRSVVEGTKPVLLWFLSPL